MKFSFNHHREQERRLLYFAGPESPTPQPEEVESQTNTESKDTIESDADVQQKARNLQQKAEDMTATQKRKLERTQRRTQQVEAATDSESDTPEAPEAEKDPTYEAMEGALTKLGMSQENAKAFVESVAALKELIDAFKSMNKEKNGDVAEPDKKIERSPEESNESRTDDSSESAETSSESAEQPSISMVQNPKEEAEKMGNVEQKEQDLEDQIEAEGAKLDGDTTASERIAIIKNITDLHEQLVIAEQNVERKQQLVEEQERRNSVVDNSWEQAKAKVSDVPDSDRIASSVTLDGDDLVIDLNQDAQGIAEQFKQMGLTVTETEKGIVINDVTPNVFSDEGIPVLQKVMNPLAEAMQLYPTILEKVDEPEPSMSEKDVTKIRTILEAHRQDVEEQYNNAESPEAKRDGAQAVVDALDAEIDFLESQGVSVDRSVEGEQVSLVNRLKQKRENFQNKLTELSKDLPPKKADPDSIPDTSELYTRKRVEEYRQSKEEGYTSDPSRKNAQLVVDAIDAELAYLDSTDQNPMRRGGGESTTLRDRLERKREDYITKLEG